MVEASTTDENLPLRRLGFLTIGLFDPADPAAGHEDTLRIIAHGEELGFDSAWVRQRHLQFGISSPVALLAAATQRTSRIELGIAVIPLGPENPLRLAEDLATVDVLSAGRLNPGVSVGTPMQWEHWKDALYPDTQDQEDFSKKRVERLLDALAGEEVSDLGGKQGVVETYSRTVQPHAPGLAGRVWYGAGSRASTEWAAAHGMNLLTSSVISAEVADDFDTNQRAQIDLYRKAFVPDPRFGAPAQTPRVSQGLCVVPTDHATPEQIRRYTAWRAERSVRDGKQFGPKKTMFAADLVGSSAQIAETLASMAAFRAVDEVAFALPFDFEAADYLQILDDIAGTLAPQLGWRPGTPAEPAAGRLE
ncbi:LLM class flavin-dependent oxidoreductase [Brevibacterium moorei]|uniref:LLM class flavin-dependent oxidoreductase n=1 Tax=Brevibacterium moorei TaxID=2968457 RepID=UPI00211C0D46|nr:LLM class flavin-dependent oxidoreductase [Brevibacterium sp. 68QC2CO]MCQ9386301.1 LLM class flavin-dependent oxidoreductase [Brevibacterium sp. 68QC2CO]